MSTLLTIKTKLRNKLKLCQTHTTCFVDKFHRNTNTFVSEKFHDQGSFPI